MKKFLQILTILTLLTWGVLFLQFYLSGRIEKFLDPAFRDYALISGIVMILMGLFNFINRNRDTGVCTHDHAHGDACDHDHHHDHGEQHESHGHSATCNHDHDHEKAHAHTHDHEDSPSSVAFAVFILLVPVLVASAYSRDQFSGDYLAKWGKIERQMMQMRIARQRENEKASMSAVGSDTNPYTSESIEGDGETPGSADTPPDPNREGGENSAWGTFTLEDLKEMVPQNTDGDFLLDVPQIFYTAGDKELMQVMEGIPVETTAQLMEETLNNPNQTRLKAFRVFIECCAADARPLSIPIEFGKKPPSYTEMGWYRIFGKLHYLDDEDGVYPILKIDRIEETMEPTDGLLY